MNTPATSRERPQETPDGARGAAAAPQRFGAGVDRMEWRDAVWESRDLRSLDKLVALTYEKFAGDGTTRVFVAPETLAQHTGLGRTAYIAARRRLEEAGWLTVSEPARQNYSTRYALTLPAALSRPSGEPLDGNQPSASRTPDTLSRPPRDTSRPRDDTSRPPRGPEPQPELQPQPTRAPIEHAAALTAVPTNVDGLVAEMRSQRLASGLTAGTLTAHAYELARAGWTTPDLARALAAKDFTGARGPGLLRSHLTELARTSPALPATRTPADTSRCEDHGTAGAQTCSSCWSEVKTRERHPDDVGRIPRRHPEAVPA